VAAEIQVRCGQLTDADAISRLINDAFRSERFFIDEDRIDVEGVRKLMFRGKFLLAEEAGGLLGCVYIEIRDVRGYFGLLAVIPGRQGSGVGSRMIALAEEECRAAGCSFMDLTIVNLRKELPGYYRKLGYAESGAEPFAAAERAKMPCHLVRMSKRL
jgi:GNAT superfamily N-acetyltransferase